MGCGEPGVAIKEHRFAGAAGGFVGDALLCILEAVTVVGVVRHAAQPALSRSTCPASSPGPSPSGSTRTDRCASSEAQDGDPVHPRKANIFTGKMCLEIFTLRGNAHGGFGGIRTAWSRGSPTTATC